MNRCVFSLLVVTALLSFSDAFRKNVKRHQTNSANKFIAGVPVLNYQTAYEGVELVQADTEGDWVVMMKGGTTDADIQRLCKKATAHGCKLTGHPSEGGVAFLEMRGTEKDLEAVIKSSYDMVKFIEPDSTVSMIPEIQAEPEAATWGLNRIGADARSRTGGKATVFVLDTGVRHSHNDFGGRASSALDMTVGSPKECNGDLSCAADRQGHGTHCAGTAAGETYGVAPAAKVMSVKVLSDRGSGSWSWSYYALDWLASNPTRPAIASMSLGGSGTQQAMADAVNAAVNSGVMVVVAGGNSNSDACRFSPAFVPAAVTVGSTDSRDRRSSFSNYGSCTDMWAPGSGVTSAGHRSDTASATFSGTSMACPHVSGGAALVMDADPDMAPAKVLAELLNGAAKGFITGLKSGDTNALLFVGEGGPPPAPPAPPAECPFYCGLRLCLLDACVDNCDFCQDAVLAENNGCKSQSDQEQIRRQRSTLSDEVTNIVIGCIGRDQSCINSQIQAKGFSASCSACVGNMGTCAKDNCKFTCTWNGFKSQACKDCTVQYCFDGLVSCSGLPREQLPDP